jgi:hypothetical protein
LERGVKARATPATSTAARILYEVRFCMENVV